jgi:CheY-like chemotaxis protein
LSTTIRMFASRFAPGCNDAASGLRSLPAVPLVAISGYAFSGPAAESPHFVQMALRPGATRCLRKPFRPATLLGVIDECLSEVEPHRKYVAAPSAVTSAPSVPERQDVGGRRAGDRLSAQWKF